MASVKDNGASVGAPAVGDGMSAFYTEVRVCAYIIALLPNVRWQISSIQDSLRTFNDNVNRISDLHSRSLNNMDDAASQRNTAQLDELVADTSALSATLKRRIKALEKQGGSGRDGQIRKQQVRFTSIVGLTRNWALLAVRRLWSNPNSWKLFKGTRLSSSSTAKSTSSEWRGSSKLVYHQCFRKIFLFWYRYPVKPDATPEEVRAVVNDEQGGQIFSQAVSGIFMHTYWLLTSILQLMNSNRYGESRAAYREVQERHEDIKRIETTLAELAQLFNDVSMTQDAKDFYSFWVDERPCRATRWNDQCYWNNRWGRREGHRSRVCAFLLHVIPGWPFASLGYTEKAVVSARAARKKRWICFILTLVILAIVAIVVAVVVTNNIHKKPWNLLNRRRFHASFRLNS